jgi:lysophospholipase
MRDLRELLEKKIKPTSTGPIVLLASSMGAAVALHAMEETRSLADAAILISPMWKLKTIPFSPKLARFLAEAMCFLGFGQYYVFGYKDLNPDSSNFDSNSSTHDRLRFEKQMTLLKKCPPLSTSGPTFQWLKSAFMLIDFATNQRRLSEVATPILVFSVEHDQVVDSSQDKNICGQLLNCEHVIVSNAKHSLHIETDNIRSLLLSKIHQFIGKTIG